MAAITVIVTRTYYELYAKETLKYKLPLMKKNKISSGFYRKDTLFGIDSKQ